MPVRRYTPRNYYYGAGVNLAQGQYLRSLANISDQLGGIAFQKRLDKSVAEAAAKGLVAQKGERATGGGAQAQVAFNRAAAEREQNITLSELSMASNQIYNANDMNPEGFDESFAVLARDTMEATSPDLRPVMEAELVSLRAEYLVDISNNLRKRQGQVDAVQTLQSFETRMRILEGQAATGKNVDARAQIAYEELSESQFVDPKTARSTQDAWEKRLAFTVQWAGIEQAAKDDPVTAQETVMRFKDNPPKGLRADEAESVGDNLLERISEVVALEERRERQNAAVKANNNLSQYQADIPNIQNGRITVTELLANPDRYGDYNKSAIAMAKETRTQLTGDHWMKSSFNTRIMRFIDAGDTDGVYAEVARAYEYVGKGLSLDDANELAQFGYSMTESEARTAGVGSPEFNRWSAWLEVQLSSTAPDAGDMWMFPGAGPATSRRLAEVAEAKARLVNRVSRAARDDQDEPKSMGQVAKEILAEMDYEADKEFNIIRPSNKAIQDMLPADKWDKADIMKAEKFLDYLYENNEIPQAQWIDNQQTLDAMSLILRRQKRYQELQTQFDRNKPVIELGENLIPGLEVMDLD